VAAAGSKGDIDTRSRGGALEFNIIQPRQIPLPLFGSESVLKQRALLPSALSRSPRFFQLRGISRVTGPARKPS
jgi:hypothetical protein